MARNGNGNGFEARQRRVRKGTRKRSSRGGGGKGFPIWLSAIVVLGAIGFIGILVAAAIGIIAYRNYADELVAPDELAINKPSYGAKIYDRNGALLYEYVDDRAGLRRPVKLADVSPALLAATIATEDDTFFTNPGINVKGLARAAWENFSPLSGTPGVLGGSGGSSITQQLVKNVYIAQQDRQKRSISRKIKETVFAMELTNRYDKERILEWYVNQIGYGGVYNGIEAASEGYFGKPAKDLTLGEAALLAGIPQSPAAYDPVNYPDAAARRRDEVLDLMQRQGRIQIGKDTFYDVKPDEIAAAHSEPVNIAEKRFPVQAPHFVLEYVQPQLEQLFGHDALYRDGLVVTTTLDINLQNQAQDIMENWIEQFENTSNSHNGSVMVMDPKTGEILTMIGSRDYFRDDIQGKNNNATACNSPGSSFKPFAYVTAFQKLGWGPGTMILDTPVSYPQSDGTVFTPSNPEHDFSGPTTVRKALGNSLNIPADKTAAAVGPDNVVAEARKFGFMNTFRLTSQGGCSAGGGYGPAIATGGVGVTLEEMMLGYTVFANSGVLIGQTPIDAAPRRSNERDVDPVAILKVTDAQGNTRFDIEKNRKQERVIPADYTYLISDILSDGQSQCATFGCGGITIPGRKAAVKTGTSEPFTSTGANAGKIGETWAFTYTPDYVVGIWAGNSDNSPVVNIFSTSISFRTVRDVLQAAYNGRTSGWFDRPAGVVDGTVCVPSGLKPTPLCGKTTSDIFAKDSLPTQDDTWWQRVRLDVRNGMIAGPATPPQLTQEQVMLVPPADLMKTDDDRKAMKDWADNLGVPLAPTDLSNGQVTPGAIGGIGGIGAGGITSPLDLSVVVLSPQAGANVQGQVQIVGRTTGPYRVEYGAGASPATWQTIAQSNTPVPAGTLANWNAVGLPDGQYTIRVTVQDRVRGQVSTMVTLNLGAGGGAAAPPPAPTPTPPPPLRP